MMEKRVCRVGHGTLALQKPFDIASGQMGQMCESHFASCVCPEMQSASVCV